MSKELSRNSAIEAMRFFFMAVICVHHSHFLPAMRHGYLAVEFFFILSGVFIYRAFLRLDSPSPMEYTIGRIKKIWPKYFVALLLTMGALYQRAIEMFKNGRGWEYVMNVFNDVLMISSLGIYKGEVNSTLWYVVVLIFGGGILYALLKWNSRFTISIILPLSALFYYTYIFNEGDCVEYWGADGFIYHPLLRGVADMSIGIVCWHIFSRINIFNRLHNKKLCPLLSKK